MVKVTLPFLQCIEGIIVYILLICTKFKDGICYRRLDHWNHHFLEIQAPFSTILVPTKSTIVTLSNVLQRVSALSEQKLCLVLFFTTTCMACILLAPVGAVQISIFRWNVYTSGRLWVDSEEVGQASWWQYDNHVHCIKHMGVVVLIKHSTPRQSETLFKMDLGEVK